MCAKNCPEKAIEMIDNLAVIDQSKCTRCGLCIEKCPQKCILDFAASGEAAPISGKKAAV